MRVFSTFTLAAAIAVEGIFSLNGTVDSGKSGLAFHFIGQTKPSNRHGQHFTGLRNMFSLVFLQSKYSTPVSWVIKF